MRHGKMYNCSAALTELMKSFKTLPFVAKKIKAVGEKV